MITENLKTWAGEIKGLLTTPRALGILAILYALLLPGKGLLDQGWVLAILYTIIVSHSAYLFLKLNHHGWESNRVLAIGIGGGIGWMMLLNVWGVIWRIQKRLIAWTKANAENGAPMPEQAKRMARIAFLTSRASAVLHERQVDLSLGRLLVARPAQPGDGDHRRQGRRADIRTDGTAQARQGTRLHHR